MSLSFKGHTVVVTGAGGGLGKAYSLLFAARSANVVVNDFNGEAAQKVVNEIKRAGGNAVVNTSSVTDGAAVIQSAIDAFGGITILVNNAGILRDKGFKNMSDAEFDQVIAVHLKGAYACTKAAWPHFRNQKFGRIVNTSSAAGIYGNFGQANYSAAKMGLIGFTKALAREGAKYNIDAIAVAPAAASKMTETIMPPEMLEKLKPEFVAPFVAAVCHPDGPNASGRVFEVGAGFVAENRWERSRGTIWKTDGTLTPSAVKFKWSEESAADVESMLDVATTLPPNPQSTPLVQHGGQTVIVTGAGAGLGRAYALMYGRLGANVVVNDLSEKGANAVCEEVRQAGGKAVPVICSAEAGDGIVKAALDAFGGVHVLVANAGILRDRSFVSMSEQEWDLVMAVHLKGTYKPVWPIFQKQKYGRIVTTCSPVGVHGNFGQTNYCAAKAAIMGLTKTLAFEGKKYDILCNVIVPSAGTAMTMTVWPKEMVDAYKPDYIAPVVGYLTSQDNTKTTGRLFEITGGWAAETRWQRTGGHGFPTNVTLTPEDIIAKWDVFTNFDDGRATYPTTTAEAMEALIENFDNTMAEPQIIETMSKLPAVFVDPEDSQLVADAKKQVPEDQDYSYTERDVILYNLGIGATEQELQWTYEGDDGLFGASSGLPLGWLPSFNPAKLLHGEQYLSIKGPIPTEAEVVNETRFLEVLDKGKAASVTTLVQTRDKATGKLLFENQATIFIRGAGGFGGKRTGADRGAATAANTPPRRAPDAVMEEKTFPAQAALYRLILPEFAAIGGFDKPVLHGTLLVLCFMGIAGKHVLKTYGAYKDIKVRFAGVVYPGETLTTEMWKEGNKVIFTMKTKERGTIVLTSAAVTLADGDKAKL
ncbi:hypothetical protein EV363DRAFT_1401459 [Boletus edulis]|nr:hypothetical protein EV363DRAFT_1401459 [Boletus edulis]